MRNNDPIFFPTGSESLQRKQVRDKNYTDCINILQTQWYQADLDQRFALGDQDLWGLIFPGVATYRRKIFNFNLINSFLQTVTGHQRQNRKTTICIPVHNSQQQTADQMTKCLYHVHKDQLYHTYSDCFELGALTQGIGLIGFYKDLTNDPISGDIKGRYIDFKSVLMDPYFRNPDLSDCRFIQTRQFFDRMEACQLYPQFESDIMNMPSGSYRDDKFYYMPEVYQIQFPNVIAFDEYWYLSTRQCEYIVDTETQEIQEFYGNEQDKRNIVANYKNRLKFITKPKPTTRRSIILNDREMVDEPNPYHMDRYPYAACLGYFTADTPYYAYKFRGMVRDLRDAQYLFNRRKVADLDIIESQQQGLKIKQGSLITPDDGLNSGNGRMLVIKKGFDMTDVEPMPIIPPAPGLLQMEEMLKDVMHRIAGVDPAAMGFDVDDKAGIISMLRQAATTKTLTKLFDNFDLFQRQCGDIIIEMIQKNWTYGKVKQVCNEEPTAEFDNKAFFKYGCKIIQGSLTETQEQLQLQQLLYFRETTGIPIPSKVILEASTLQNKEKLIEAVMEQEKQQQEQLQKREELEMQQIAIDNQAKISYAHSQEGLAAERMAKIQLDKALNAERLQRADEDRTNSVLNLVKAIKEIQGLDIGHISQYLDIIDRIEGENSEKSQTKEVSNA